MPSPSRLTLFENRVFWSDATKQGVMSVDKYQGPNTILSIYKQRTIKDPKAVKALHPLAQPYASNPCGTNNGGCQQMCIVTAPSEVSGSLGYRCACHIGRKLAADRRSCDGEFFSGGSFLLIFPSEILNLLSESWNFWMNLRKCLR